MIFRKEIKLLGSMAVITVLMGCMKEQTSEQLEAIVPTNEALSVGMAGDEPADISRYLLASGFFSDEGSPDLKEPIVYTSGTLSNPTICGNPWANLSPPV